jgi:DNA-binding XRE family transcriptional regulator
MPERHAAATKIDVAYINTPALRFHDHAREVIPAVITAAQMRAARALLGIDQRTLADLAGVSLPTIQRMEASEGNVRGVVDTLTKVVEALDRAGIELIGDNARSDRGGRGVRFRTPPEPPQGKLRPR